VQCLRDDGGIDWYSPPLPGQWGNQTGTYNEVLSVT
jgi:hypothetical protein